MELEPIFIFIFQEKLTNKRKKSENEDEKFYSDLPKKFSTNHFDENQNFV